MWDCPWSVASGHPVAITPPRLDPTTFNPHSQMDGGQEAMPGLDALAAEQREKHAFTHLFDGLVFFLSREVPRYSLEPVIRAFGGSVSWQGVGGEGGGPIPEADSRITHHIVDRPQLPDNALGGRSYVQPQWVYDSINARMVRVCGGGEGGCLRSYRAGCSGMVAPTTHMRPPFLSLCLPAVPPPYSLQLLPTADYAVGATLPAHLSPFVEEGEGDYVPPERQEMLAKLQGIHEVRVCGVGRGLFHRVHAAACVQQTTSHLALLLR